MKQQDLLEVEVYRDGEMLGARRFDQQVIKIGSAWDAELRLRDDRVDPSVAVVEREANGWQLRINGHVRPLRGEQLLTVGPFELSFCHRQEIEQSRDFDDEVEEDEDEEDEDFVEPFSLLENIVAQRQSVTERDEVSMIAEVIAYRDGELVDLMRVAPGETLRVGPDQLPLLKMRADGRGQLRWTGHNRTAVVHRGTKRQLSRPGRQRRAMLAVGDYAQVIRSEGAYLLRFVAAPDVSSVSSQRPAAALLDRRVLPCVAGSAACHLTVLLLLAVLVPQEPFPIDETFVPERRAVWIPAELRPEPKKAPEPEPEPEQQQPPRDEPRRKPKHSTVSAHKSHSRRSSGRLRREASSSVGASQVARKRAQQVGVLMAALHHNRGTLRAALPGRINIESVRSSGSGAGFRTAGVLGKNIGGVKAIGGGGSGGPATRGGGLLSGSRVGTLVATAGTGSRVRRKAIGDVRRVRVDDDQGRLPREEILRVINRNMHHIQACYERALISNPALGGKASFEWRIGRSGAVIDVKLKRSTLRSHAVSGCIIGVIRGLRFGRPQGGTVRVFFPFLFRRARF